jgi:vitamin B12 transporter
VTLIRPGRALRRSLTAHRLCIYTLLITLAAHAQQSAPGSAEQPTGEDPALAPDTTPTEPERSAPAPEAEPPSADGATEPAPENPPPSPDAPAPAAASQAQSGAEPRTEESTPAASPAPIEIAVRGRKLQEGVDRSTRAVTNVDLRRAKLESADLGSVLSRVEGVNVQRVGGLGSEARFSLAGFDETQIRFFIDGVPLELAGYPFGFQNVPISFGERVEVFKGVVPVNLGTDALGGAFNLITDRRTTGMRAAASYDVGSFGLHRLSAGARYRDASSGFFVKAEAFLDRADNDYPVHVKVADRTGIISETKAYRFHDAYGARGGNVEVGLVDRPWARRLLLRVFATDYRKEIQHNSIMTAPYGEAEEGGISTGASLRYENTFAGHLTTRAVGGYVHSRSDFLDDSTCIYNWFGQCANMQVTPGEIAATATDVSVWDRTGFLRAGADWTVSDNHRLRFAIAPTYHDRTGDDRLKEINDAATAERTMFKWVNGLEYEAQLLDGKLVNAAFVKHYLQSARSDETFAGATSNRHADRRLWGVGDGLRYELLTWLFVKASYEFATRLPEPKEVFGNGGFVLENLTLSPERSHNVNLTLGLDDFAAPVGKLNGNVTGFFREADNLIMLFPLGEVVRYENVYEARVVGVEGALSWLSPGEHVELAGNATYQNLRNASHEGPLALFEGERIPNKPYFWANARARLQKRAFAAADDSLSLTWYTRYTRDFYRSWEGAGRKGPEDSVPDQLTHGAVMTYATSSERARQLAVSGEVHNITDERVFDFLGVQRPGRAAYFKVTLSY